MLPDDLSKEGEAEMQDDVIEAIRDANPIEDVIREYTRVREHQGKNWDMVCPFHTTSTFDAGKIVPAEGFFYCFNCGAHGDVFEFVRRIRSISFREAVAMLAERAHMALPDSTEEISPELQLGRLRDAIIGEAAHFYHGRLHAPENGEAIAYLEAERGIHTGEGSVTEDFLLGYAEGKDSLKEYLMSRGFTLDQMKRVGLINKQERDTYFDRVVVPIRRRGRFVNLYGRSISGSKIKHLLLSDIGAAFFNADAARGTKKVVLMEGPFDALATIQALREAGVRDYAVTALCGTQKFGQGDVHMLARFGAEEVFIAMDRDANNAGQNATERIAQVFQTTSVSGNGERRAAVRVVNLPDNCDPNEYFLERGGTARSFVKLLESATHPIEFILESRFAAMPKGRAATVTGKLEIVGHIEPYFGMLKYDPLRMEIVVRKIAQMLQVSETSVQRTIMNHAAESQAREVEGPVIRGPRLVGR